jgi:hypothetical protein
MPSSPKVSKKAYRLAARIAGLRTSIHFIKPIFYLLTKFYEVLVFFTSVLFKKKRTDCFFSGCTLIDLRAFSFSMSVESEIFFHGLWQNIHRVTISMVVGNIAPNSVCQWIFF